MSSLTLVSVDWDYCIPIDVWYAADWGHHESTTLFYEMIWNIRGQSGIMMNAPEGKKQVSLDKIEADITLPSFGIPKLMGMGISHGHAYPFFKEVVQEYGQDVDTIYLYTFDLHHDFWITEDVDCTSWLYFLAKEWSEKYKVKIIWIKPKWFKREGYDPDAFDYTSLKKKLEAVSENISVSTRTGYKENIEADALYFCRSDAWTPPHLDRQYIDLLMGYIEKVVQKYNLGCVWQYPIGTEENPKMFDPLTQRKCLYNEEQFLKAQEDFKLAVELNQK